MGGLLKVDVSPLLGEAGATLEVDTEVPLEAMTVGDSHVKFEEPPRLRVILANAGEVIVASGTVQAAARLDCTRCLEPFDLDLVGTVDAVISPTEDPELIDEDQEWYPLEGDAVDLFAAADAALRVEVPFAPVHDEACLGICPICGCDRNRDTCACRQEPDTASENPFAVLKDLVPPTED